MHPNRAFDWDDASEMLCFVSERAFAHVFTASEAGLFVVHVPVLVRNGSIGFHVSRRNRIADQLEDRRLLVSIAGRDAYHSANWYASDDQVPTWFYESVEIEGKAFRLSDEGLVELLDGLTEKFEDRHSPEGPWTREKMSPGRFEAMTRALVGFELEPVEIRGTRKFNQHKSGDDLAATIQGQRTARRDDIVTAISETARLAKLA
jgi:transcriptional regulator